MHQITLTWLRSIFMKLELLFTAQHLSDSCKFADSDFTIIVFISLLTFCHPLPIFMFFLFSLVNRRIPYQINMGANL